MMEQDQNSTQRSESSEKKPAVNKGRRKLFGASLAAPVVMSLSSRTAWGGTLCAPSAFNSATFASHHPSEANDCAQSAGYSPSYWRDNPTAWPSAYLADAATTLDSTADPDDITAECSVSTSMWGADNGYYFDEVTGFATCRSPSRFNEVFGVSIFDPEVTLMEVLKNKTGANSLGGDIEASAVAALLNAEAGNITLGEPSQAYAVAKVIEIFSTLMTGSGYVMSTGQEVYWNSDPNSVGFTMSDYFTASYIA
jgi:hypothetical protein